MTLRYLEYGHMSTVYFGPPGRTFSPGVPSTEPARSGGFASGSGSRRRKNRCEHRKWMPCADVTADAPSSSPGCSCCSPAKRRAGAARPPSSARNVADSSRLRHGPPCSRPSSSAIACSSGPSLPERHFGGEALVQLEIAVADELGLEQGGPWRSLLESADVPVAARGRAAPARRLASEEHEQPSEELGASAVASAQGHPCSVPQRFFLRQLSLPGTEDPSRGRRSTL